MAVTVSYIGARGDHLPLGGTVDTVVNINQLDPKYLALGAALNQQVPNPFFGNPAAGPLATQATLTRGAAAAAVSAVPERPGPAGLRRRQPLQRRRHRVEQAADARAGSAAASATPTACSRTTRSARRTSTRTTATACRSTTTTTSSMPACTTTNYAACFNPLRRLRLRHPRRAAPRDHRADLAAAVRRGSAVGARAERANVARRRLDGVGGRQPAERLPDRPHAERQHAVRRRATAEPRRRSASRPPADFADRLASADHPTATWINPAAFTAGAGGHLRQRAAPHHRRADAADQEHRPLVLQEHSARRRRQRRSRSRSSTCSTGCRPTASARQREIRRSARSVAVRLHAADAGDVPLLVLKSRWTFLAMAAARFDKVVGRTPTRLRRVMARFVPVVLVLVMHRNQQRGQGSASKRGVDGEA